MIVYIAGKMTGLTDYGRAYFLAAQKALEQAGHIVLNPGMLPIGLAQKDYLPITLAMLNAADAVFMLTGWEHSLGAKVEGSFASYQGIKVYEEGVREDREALGIEGEAEAHELCIDCANYSGGMNFGHCELDKESEHCGIGPLCENFKKKGVMV